MFPRSKKTKPAYDTYRKARNKDRYRAAHEGTVILHEAAAKALKAAGISKLPNLATLQAEYEKLQEQEEALSADSRKRKTGQGIIQSYHAEQR